MTTNAEKAAIDLLSRLGVKRPPVNPWKVAERLGVKVVEEPLEDDVSGMIYRQFPKTLVLVNALDTMNRKRFTIAHELGHHILHEEDLVFVDGRLRRDSRAALGVDNKEIDANQFAAALLMPREWIFEEVNRRRARRQVPEDEKFIKELACVFSVSGQAMEYRLANLGILGTF